MAGNDNDNNTGKRAIDVSPEVRRVAARPERDGGVETPGRRAAERRREDRALDDEVAPASAIRVDGRSLADEEIPSKLTIENAKEPSKARESSRKDESSEKARLEQLREELACAVCLDICYEPSTTACGHSFCRRCLNSALNTCGSRCPRCRELIKKERALNVVLWNTIQILFPEEVAKRRETESATEAAATARVSTTNRNGPTRIVDRNRPIGNFRRSTSGDPTTRSVVHVQAATPTRPRIVNRLNPVRVFRESLLNHPLRTSIAARTPPRTRPIRATPTPPSPTVTSLSTEESRRRQIVEDSVLAMQLQEAEYSHDPPSFRVNNIYTATLPDNSSR